MDANKRLEFTVKLYEKYLKRILKRLDKSHTIFAKEGLPMKVVEITAAMCAAIEYVAFDVGMGLYEGDFYIDGIKERMFLNYADTQHMGKYFSARFDFYYAVLLEEKHIMGFFMPGYNFSGRQNLMVRLAAAFSDCCMGQVYIDDYDKSPLMLVGIEYAMAMTDSFLFPLRDEFSDFVIAFLKKCAR